ncbi:MAG TPA: M23 family metallopeptidase [Cyclobacteriaceae bacterium]
MKPKKTFSNWLFNRYFLIIRNEEDFAEKRSVSFTYAKVIVLGFSFLVVVMILSFFLVETLLAQWFDPRHAQMEANRQLIRLTLELDSLESEVQKKDLFIHNFQNIVAGRINNEGADGDTENNNIDELQAKIDEMDYQAIDSQFRKQFETNEVSLLTYNSGERAELQELFLFSPIDGIISQKYNVRNEHYGVDVVAKKNEPVKCVADGTVILASWTQDSGYIIAVQHRGNLISVYKHNDVLLEKVGNFVSAGEIISISGNTGELTDGTHLHFELWYNGNPVNPEEFVTF